ncbi:glycosyltransferase family 2 protein [Patescibacteria group bacterium]|nr:glycosyltransferase family 2 protein [Patescibacteria group bacterium]MCL5091448.1 glycosyltransferase family 2 protein [Patescibacteria group bacterium]
MNKISAIIVVKDRPPHLQETINSVQALADEIIIGSINLSPEQVQTLQKHPKIKVVAVPADTPFADLVKEELKQQARHDWVLYLDPDEVFPKNTGGLIRAELAHYDCFLFPRKNLIFGKWIEHSRWWPDYQVRLYRKSSVIWPAAIHPQPKINGRQFRFPAHEENAILHYNYDNLDQYLTKAMRYAKTEAQMLTGQNQPLTLAATINKSLSEFVSRFFAGEGYRDGMHGLALAFLQMFYYLLVYFYYWEMHQYRSETKDNLSAVPQQFFKSGLKQSHYWINKKNLVAPQKRIILKIINRIIAILP